MASGHVSVMPLSRRILRANTILPSEKRWGDLCSLRDLEDDGFLCWVKVSSKRIHLLWMFVAIRCAEHFFLCACVTLGSTGSLIDMSAVFFGASLQGGL